MDFKLSGEQALIKDSVERFVQQPVPADAWGEFAKLGWLAIGAPDELGGFGGALERLLVLEAFGRGLCREPFASCAVFPAAVLREAGRNDLLERLIEGNHFAIAFEEPQARYDPSIVATRAERKNGGYVLRGRKTRVPVVRGEGAFLVSAAGEDGIGLFEVAPGAAGLQRDDCVAEDGMTVSELVLDGVSVEDGARIGLPNDGLRLLQRGLEHAIAGLCAEAVGVMSVMFEMTLKYLKERTQFGVLIGSFQALQHRMADMFVELELARSMAFLAAMTVDDEKDPAARAKAISGAKVQIARSGRFVGQNAIQLHGAIAMTQEYRLGDYFKRMTVLERLYGDPDYHLGCVVSPQPISRAHQTQLTRA